MLIVVDSKYFAYQTLHSALLIYFSLSRPLTFFFNMLLPHSTINLILSAFAFLL